MCFVVAMWVVWEDFKRKKKSVVFNKYPSQVCSEACYSVWRSVLDVRFATKDGHRRRATWTLDID